MKTDTEVALRLPPPSLCELDYHYCKASDLLTDTSNTSGDSGGGPNHRVMKRKLRDLVDSYRDEEFYLERPAPKRVSPFLNTPKQRKDERKRIVRLSVHKLRAMEDPENFLRKSVLINNVLRRLHQEIREEKQGYTRFSGSLGLPTAGYPYYRPRRIDYDMLGNSYLPTPAAFLFDEPCFPTETEKITDDMTDSLVRSLEASTPPTTPPPSPAPVNHLTTTTTTTVVSGLNITTTPSLISLTTTTNSTTTTHPAGNSATTTNTTSVNCSTTTLTSATTTTTTTTNTTSSNSLPGNAAINNNHICNGSTMCINNNNSSNNNNNDNNNNYNIINLNTYNNNNTNTNTTTNTTTTNTTVSHNNNNIHHNNLSTSNFLNGSHAGFTSYATTSPTGLTDYRNTGIASAGITVQEKQISVDMDVVFNNLIRALGET